jgi:hypothetical protein
MVLQWSANHRLSFPKDVPKGRGRASDRHPLRQRPKPLTRPLLELRMETDLWVVLGSGVRDFKWRPVSLYDTGLGLAIVAAQLDARRR